MKSKNRYIDAISQITELPYDKVLDVFKYYKMLVLNDICNHDGSSINIELPCFCTLKLSNNNGNLSIKIPYNKQKDIYPDLYNAFFLKKNPILDDLISSYSNQLKNDIYNKVNEYEEK